MDVFTRIIGFGLAAANLDGSVVCRMFNRAIAKRTPRQYLSSDPQITIHCFAFIGIGAAFLGATALCADVAVMYRNR